MRYIIRGKPISKKNTWSPFYNKTRRCISIYQRNRFLKDYVESAQLQFRYRTRGKFEPIKRPKHVFIMAWVYFQKKQCRMDAHNALETLLDALQGHVYENDNQVVGVYMPPRRLVDDADPRIEFQVHVAEELDDALLEKSISEAVEMCRRAGFVQRDDSSPVILPKEKGGVK